LSKEGEELEAFEVAVPLIKSENIVDVNGAGDSFVGAFLS